MFCYSWVGVGDSAVAVIKLRRLGDSAGMIVILFLVFCGGGMTCTRVSKGSLLIAMGNNNKRVSGIS